MQEETDQKHQQLALQIQQKDQEIQQFKHQLQEKTSDFEQLKFQVQEETNQKHQQLALQIQQKNQEIQQFKHQLQEKTRDFEQLKFQVQEETDQKHQQLALQIQQKDREIEQLKRQHQYRFFGLIFLATILIGTVGYLVYKSEFKRANDRPNITNIITPSNTEEQNRKSQVTNSQKEQIISNWETAQKMAMEAVVITHNPPHTIEVWQKSQAKWEEAINLLEAIPKDAPIAAQVREKLAVYRTSYKSITNRLNTEQKAAENLETAKKLAMEASVMVQNPSQSAEVWLQAKAKWQEAISLLEAIPNNTFVSAQAKEKLTVYRTNYTAVSQR